MADYCAQFIHGASRRSDPRRWLWERWKNKRSQGKLCPEWSDGEQGFLRFYAFVSNLPGYPGRGERDVVLDQIIPNAGYYPGNVRWISRADNARNRSDSKRVGGLTLPQHAQHHGIPRGTLISRYARRIQKGNIDGIFAHEFGQSLRPSVEDRDRLLAWLVHSDEIRVDGDGRLFYEQGWKEIKPSRDTQGGYQYIKLPKACIKRYKETTGCDFSHANRFPVHRLLVFFWRGLPADPWMVVDHINHNGCDNSRTNLRWATAKENANNRTQFALKPMPSAEDRSRPMRQELKRAEPLPPEKPRPPAAQFELADKLMGRYSEQIQASILRDDSPLVRSILAAPSNMACEVNGVLQITVLMRGGKHIARSFSLTGDPIRRTDRVYLACQECGFESPDTRPEIRDKVAGTARFRAAACTACTSLAVLAPRLADLLSADPRTGKIDDPYRVPGKTAGIRAWFRCAEPGCTHLAGIRAVKNLVAHYCEGGVLPKCEEHRLRLLNFTGAGSRRPRTT